MKKRVKDQLSGFGSSSSYMIFKLLTLFLLCLIFNVASGVALAETKKQDIFLGELNESFKNGIMLKNVRDKQHFFFTKPKTWKILGGSNLVIKFQHSSELLPDRSFLKISLNGKLVKKVALDSSSIDTKTLEIPLPVSSLGDYNTVDLAVEQHYTTKCEDPLDPSLWTRINEETHVSYTYDDITPKVNLSSYPFPLFDEFGYGPSEVTYILPDKESISSGSLNAAGIIASSVAQKISWRPLRFKASVGNNPIDSNTNNIIVGMPDANSAIVKLMPSLSSNIKQINGQYVVLDKNGSPLADEKGLIAYINNPNNPKKVILVITANSEDGIETAAKYLSNKEEYKKLQGAKAIITEYNPVKLKSENLPKYVYNKSMSFEQLGFETIQVKRIGSAPIIYPIRVMPDMLTSKDKLAIELDYSYSKGLNPELSSLEVKFNDLSLKGSKLDNPNGVANKKLRVKIPSEYVKPFNILTVKFHIFPSKFQYCKDFYDDQIWGKVSKISKVTLPSDAKVVLPDLALFNDQIFPYTVSQDLSNTAVILPDALSSDLLSAYINIIAAIGKATNSDTGINLITLFANNSDNRLLSNRDVILISDNQGNDLMNSLQGELLIQYKNSFKEFSPYKNRKAILNYANTQGVMQQIASVFDKKKVMTMFYGKTGPEALYASGAVANKKLLSKVNDDTFYTLDSKNIYGVVIPGLAKRKKAAVEESGSILDELWPPSSPLAWVITVIVFLVVIFIVVFVIRLIFRI